MNEKDLPNDPELSERMAVIADFERMADFLKDHGKALGGYYCSMTEHGVPEDLAGHLVIQWQQLFWIELFDADGDDEDEAEPEDEDE